VCEKAADGNPLLKRQSFSGSVSWKRSGYAWAFLHRSWR
jgi:hypothetical protein